MLDPDSEPPEAQTEMRPKAAFGSSCSYWTDNMEAIVKTDAGYCLCPECHCFLHIVDLEQSLRNMQHNGEDKAYAFMKEECMGPGSTGHDLVNYYRVMPKFRLNPQGELWSNRDPGWVTQKNNDGWWFICETVTEPAAHAIANALGGRIIC